MGIKSDKLSSTFGNILNIQLTLGFSPIFAINLNGKIVEKFKLQLYRPIIKWMSQDCLESFNFYKWL
mgnify:FL=1